VPEKHVTCEFVEGDSLDDKVDAFARKIADVMSAARMRRVAPSRVARRIAAIDSGRCSSNDC